MISVEEIKSFLDTNGEGIRNFLNTPIYNFFKEYLMQSHKNAVENLAEGDLTDIETHVIRGELRAIRHFTALFNSMYEKIYPTPKPIEKQPETPLKASDKPEQMNQAIVDGEVMSMQELKRRANESLLKPDPRKQ
jgi:hypothetical protein